MGSERIAALLLAGLVLAAPARALGFPRGTDAATVRGPLLLASESDSLAAPPATPEAADSVAPPAAAGTPPAAPATPADSAAPSPCGFRPHWVFSLRAGSYAAPEREGHLVHAAAPFALGATFGFLRRPNLEIGGTIMILGASYDGPPIAPFGYSEVSDHRSLSSWGFGMSVREIYPSRGIQPFAEAGLSFTSTAVSAPVYDYSQLQSWLGVETGRKDESVQQFAPHVALGLDIPVSKKVALAFEYRRMWLGGDFGPLSGGDVPVAGGMYQMIVRASDLHPKKHWLF
jgi:hypothetical protein